MGVGTSRNTLTRARVNQHQQKINNAYSAGSAKTQRKRQQADQAKANKSGTTSGIPGGRRLQAPSKAVGKQNAKRAAAASAMAKKADNIGAAGKYSRANVGSAKNKQRITQRNQLATRNAQGMGKHQGRAMGLRGKQRHDSRGRFA